MRAVIPFLLAALVLLPAATAQQDGCLQSNPCVLDVEVDEQGISSVSIGNLTSGDWFVLSVSSLDERAHTVTFAGATVQVPSYGYVDSAPFQAPSPGTYKLRDEPTGDEAELHVLAGDVVAAENDAASDSKGSPVPAFGLLAVGLGAVAFLARRRA